LEDDDAASIKEKICAEWLADLQHTQENEIKTTTDLIGDKVVQLALICYSISLLC